MRFDCIRSWSLPIFLLSSVRMCASFLHFHFEVGGGGFSCGI